MREFDDALEILDRMSYRIRRLYICAVYDIVKQYAKSNPCDLGINFAKGIDDLESYQKIDKAYRTILSQHQHNAINAYSVTYDKGGNNKKHYMRVAARHLPVIALQDVPKARDISRDMWELRRLIGYNFDRQILEDLDVIGPLDFKRTEQPKDLPKHIIGLAEDVYNGNQETYPILADACEEFGINEIWLDHLRSPKRHWKGCWVIDSLLGKG